MLRSKGLTDKVLLLGIDGMDPRFSRKMVDEGKMPNLKKLIERGSARQDLRLLGAVPTITPPMWTTLATGAYPMTHGIEDFNINFPGELEINFAGIYSKYVHAEPLWNVTAEAGKKTLLWHWPGGAWPPTSDSENLMVVDGTTPGALGWGYAKRDEEIMVCASAKASAADSRFYFAGSRTTENFTGDPKELSAVPIDYPMSGSKPDEPYFDELWDEFKDGLEVNGFSPIKIMDCRTKLLMHGKSQMDWQRKVQFSVSLSEIREPEGWVNAPEGAKEFTMYQLYGKSQRVCLILKDETGVYSKVAIYVDKTSEPLVVLEKDVYTRNVKDVLPGKKGMENVVRNMRLLNIAEDGSFVRLWVSNAFSADDNCVWYPTWIFDKITGKFGPPVPTGSMAGGDLDVILKCNTEQWKQAAEWQANAMKYMMREEGVEVIFSHFHGPDLSGHTYMQWLKDREDSPHPEAEFYKLHEATYAFTDAYIGEFLPMIDEGWTILLFSDHSLICREGNAQSIADNYGINIGVMEELGYTVMKYDENGNMLHEIDWDKTRAIQQRCNSIYINLKGRDRYGIVDPADQYELEEQIITDLYGYKDKASGKRIVALALHKKDANLLGLGGDYTGADIIFFLHESFVADHGESLSTAMGHADTSVGPIFVAAGPGIKEGFTMKLFPREVDITPTAAVLLGVRFPNECEGAPVYSIFSELV